MAVKKIKVAFELRGVEGVVIDTAGLIWRLPYTNEQGKRYKLKQIKPYYERNYTAYWINSKVHSLKQIELLREAKNYTVMLYPGEVRKIYN